MRYRFAVTFTILLFVFSTITITSNAYAEFDKSGNYVCNPFNTGLETNIYASIVNQINYKLDNYLISHPNSTLQQQHDVVMQDQKTWDLYNKSKQCMDILGVNPDSVVPLSFKVNQVLAIPEFGPVVGVIIIVALVSVVIISRKTRSYF